MTVRLSVVVSPSNGVERTARTGGAEPVHDRQVENRLRAPGLRRCQAHTRAVEGGAGDVHRDAPPASVIQREPPLRRPLPVRALAALHLPPRPPPPDPATVANGRGLPLACRPPRPGNLFEEATTPS